MKAITKYTYGGPEVLQLEEIEKPKLKAGHLLVKVHANSANPADWHVMRGKPFFARFAFGLFKPSTPVLGADFAGVVEAVGENVIGYEISDKVYGEFLGGGAFAEYLVVPTKVCSKMPQNASFEEMASIPVAGLTAWQALVTHGQLQKGESVLINGSSGGVGHFAVQIAKSIGAEVTAVCSSKNIDFVKSIGADHTLAYDREDIHQHEGRYDLILDNHGNLFHSDYTRMGQRGLVIGFTTMGHMMQLMMKNAFSKFPLKQFTAEANTADLTTLAELIEKGALKPHIEKTYSYQQIPEAIGYIEAMHTRGKVVMRWEEG
jgi:NADPH:quinone reductase-like Zn-dependent oxidoreductase